MSRRELDQDLKLGRGGIREIEFIVQCLQLIRGGSDRRLQSASLLEVLPRLAGSKLMSTADIAELEDSYLVLRKAENAVQMIRDEQAHSLPTDDVDRARLSLGLGLPDWNAVMALIDSARGRVARQFEALLAGAADSPQGQGDAGADWLASEEARIDEELRGGGFPPGAIPAVAATLEAYRQAATYRRLDETGRRRLHGILGRLLKAAAQLPSPAVVVQRVLRVLEAIGTRSSYLALLRSSPPRWTA